MQSVDLLHVCYGGLGGHISVVNTLTRELRAVGISSGVMAVAAPEYLVTDRGAWPDLDFVEYVPVTRRADLTSMWTAFRIARDISARVVVMHTLRHTTPIAIARLVSRQAMHLVTRESHGLPSRNRIVDAQSASSVVWGEAVVFLTEENRAAYPLRRLPLRGLSRQVVIPNGVDTSRFAPGPSGALSRPSVLGMAARFVPGKDFDTLVRGLAILRDELGAGAPRLILAGDGPNRSSVEALVDDLGVRHLVEFLGQVPEPLMPQFFAGLDVYVQLTDGEAFSMSMIQACASLLPIVTSDVVGVRDVFADRDTALLLAPRSPRAFADAICELMAPNGELARGLAERGYRMAADRYSATRMARSYLELFAELDASGPWSDARRRLLGP